MSPNNWQHNTAHLGLFQTAVDNALAGIVEERVLERIWAQDYTIWRDRPDEITNRLGWLTSPAAMRDRIAELHALADAARADGYTHALLLGMGGSSLAPDLFAKTFTGRPGQLRLSVLDTTHPDAVLSHAARLDPTRTLFIVATKSGTTVETLSLFKFFYNRLGDLLGPARAGAHLVAITDPGSPLADLAQRLGFRATFLNDPNIGGRFSALSHFGLLPAALVGVDVTRLLDRALTAADACRECVDAHSNPGAWLGAILGTLAQKGHDKATLFISPPIAPLGDWIEQLIAESTGKDGRGILPVVGEPPASPDAYGDDRLFIHLRLDHDDTYDAAVDALQAAGHPVVRIRQHDRYGLGAQFFVWELATAVAGHLLGIHPFNQPDVEATKRLARAAVEAYKTSRTLPSVDAAPPTPAALQDFLAQAQPGDYIALQAYLPPNPATGAALQALRTRLRDRYKLATTVGYGPRFLHSTGQLHKGDRGNGLFIQLTADPSDDAPIPDEPGQPDSSLTFGVLIAAQALGDYQALRAAGRRVTRIHLKADIPATLENLSDET